MVFFEEMEMEEGEIRESEVEGQIRESSSSSEQLDATPCQDLVTLSNAGLIQSLRADQWQHIFSGILKGLLKRLETGNLENLCAFFRSYERIGTETILEFRGDPSYWTAFCATLAKGFHELTVMCQPIACDSTRHEKIEKWEAEFENWKQLVQRDLDIRHHFTEMRVNRDHMVLQLWKAPAITVESNGGLVQQIKQQEDAIDNIRSEANRVDAMRKEASAECDRLRLLVVQYDSGRAQREVNANAIYRHICFAVKNLVDELEVQ